MEVHLNAFKYVNRYHFKYLLHIKYINPFVCVLCVDSREFMIICCKSATMLLKLRELSSITTPSSPCALFCVK